MRRCAWAVRALNHIDSSMCPSAPDLEMWIIQGTLAWRTPPVRTAKLLLRRIDGAIQVRSNVDPTFDSLVGSGRSGGDHYGSSLLENPYIPYQCMDSYLSSTGLGSASMEMEHLTTHLHRPRTTRSPLSFILG
nr:trnI-GAU [Bougainvillea glabra]ULO25635.1 trnI-GAU [Bougainvillea glabra]